MACILARGFDHGSIYDFDFMNTGWTVDSGTKRAGYSTYSAKQDSYNPGTGRFYLPVSPSEFYIGMGARMGALLANYSGVVFQWKKGANVLGSVYWDGTNGVLKLYTGNTSTLVATSTLGFVKDIWYYIEVYVKIADSGGILTLRQDGLQACTYTGDTKPGSDTTVDTIEYPPPGGGYVSQYIDDVVVNDTTGAAPSNTWPSGAYVTAIVPTGAGATTQFTPSAGNNYACVDEIPPVVTDYVYPTSVDQIDSYVMGDLNAAAAVVLGIEETIFASRVGSPAASTLKPLIRCAGTDYPEATGSPVGFSVFPIRKCWSQNPATGPGDWTVANVNALEAGMKSAA